MEETKIEASNAATAQVLCVRLERAYEALVASNLISDALRVKR